MFEAVPKRFQEAGIELQDGSVAAALLNRSHEKTEKGAKKREGVKAGMIAHGGQEDHQLRRWQQQRLLKCIAEPQLVTISGRPASFRVGGRLPAPIAGAAGKTSSREYGTQVELVALARDDGTIRLEIRASHSDLDFNNTATFDGMEVPGLIVREVDTAATMQPGETLVVGSFVGKQYGLKKTATEPASGEEANEAGELAELIVLATVEYVDAM
jgi:pilus assembly protein CpaC